MSDASATLLTIAGTAVGAAASWYFSRRYYLKSGFDLDAALRRLQGDHQEQLHTVTAVGRMLERSGIGKLAYDEAGNITGIVITGAAHSTASFGPTASATVERGTPPQYDRQHEQPLSPEPEPDHA